MQAVICSGTPIALSKTMPRMAATITISEVICFHFGTELKSWTASATPAAVFDEPAGSKRWPKKAK
ncbi:hypothetical protein D3C86_1672190 [compost metagenome]